MPFGDFELQKIFNREVYNISTKERPNKNVDTLIEVTLEHIHMHVQPYPELQLSNEPMPLCMAAYCLQNLYEKPNSHIDSSLFCIVHHMHKIAHDRKM